MNAALARLGPLLPLVVVTLLAALSWWLKDLATLAEWLDGRGFQHEPGTVIEDLRLRSVGGPNGVQQVLTAQQMIHYLDDDTLRLEKPRFVRTEPGQPTLQIQSQRGLVAEDRNNFYFLEDVRLQREATGALSLLLQTEYLRVMLDVDRVRTDKPVHVAQGKSRLDAGGMEADGKARTVEFKAPVRSVYEH